MGQRQSAIVNWRWVGGAWRVITGDLFTWVLMQLTILLFIVITVSPAVILFGGIGVLSSSEESTGLAGLSLVTFALIPVLLVILGLGGVFLVAGLFKSAIRKARGESIGLADLFSAGESLPTLMAFYLLLTLTIAGIGKLFDLSGSESASVAVVLSILSRIVNFTIIGLTFFSAPLIVDRRVGVFDAIRESLALTVPHWPSYLLLAFVTEALSALGLFLFVVGVVITAPFQWTIPAVAYSEVFGLTGNQNGRSVPAPSLPERQSLATDSGSEAAIPTIRDPLENPTLPFTCPSCGTTLVRISRYCSQCGTRIGG